MVNWQERSCNKFSNRYFSLSSFSSFLDNSIPIRDSLYFQNRQVQKNKDLKVSLGPGLYYKHKVRDTVAAEKCHQSFSNDKVRFPISKIYLTNPNRLHICFLTFRFFPSKEMDEIMNKIVSLLNQLIFEEVQKKTCISLPPDLMEFLDWMLELNSQTTSLQQVTGYDCCSIVIGHDSTHDCTFRFQLPPTLPFIKGNSEEHFPRDKYLFQSFPSQRIETEITELYIKITVIRNLIKEYGTLSEKEQEKVEAIHEYLVINLILIQKKLSVSFWWGNFLHFRFHSFPFFLRRNS